MCPLFEASWSAASLGSSAHQWRQLSCISRLHERAWACPGRLVCPPASRGVKRETAPAGVFTPPPPISGTAGEPGAQPQGFFGPWDLAPLTWRFAMKRNATQRRRPAAVLTAAVATTLLFASLAPPAHAGATLEQPEVTVYRTAPLVDQPQDEVWDVLDYRDVTVQVKITEESISATKYAKIHLQTSNTKSGQDWQTMETVTFTEGTDSAPVLHHKLLNVEHSTAALGQYLRWQVEFEDATASQWIAFRASLLGRNETTNYASHQKDNGSELGRAPREASGDYLGIDLLQDFTDVSDPLDPPPPESVLKPWVKIVETYVPIKYHSTTPPPAMEYSLFLPADWAERKKLNTILVAGGQGGYHSRKQKSFWHSYGQWLAKEGFIVAFIEYRRYNEELRCFDVWTVYDKLKNSDVYPVGKIGAIGSSWGNMVMNELQIETEFEYSPELAGYVNLYGFAWGKRLLHYKDNISLYDADTRWLFQTGSNDRVLPIAEAMRDAFFEHRPVVSVSYLVYPDVGHGFFFEGNDHRVPARNDQLEFWKRAFKEGVIWREHTTHY